MSATVSSPQGKRRAVLPALGIMFALIVVLILFSTIYTDYLWFRSVHYEHVFRTMLLTRVGLFLACGAAFSVVVAGNAVLAWRLLPEKTNLGNPVLDRYVETLKSRGRGLAIGLTLTMGLFGGMAAVGAASTFLAWRHGVSYGKEDPRFGLDIGFFMFDYPWWRFVIGFVLAALVMATAVSIIVHYVLGGLRVRADSSGKHASRPATIHVSVLMALTMLVVGVNAWFDRYGRAVNTNELLTGIRYTDDNAIMVSAMVVATIAVLCAVLFVANIMMRRWTIPVVGVVLMIFAQVLLGWIYPAIIQNAVVRPNEPDLERPYIEQHLAATREAYGVEGIEKEDYRAETEATAGQLRSDADTLPGLRLMDPAVVGPAFDQLQQVRGYYSFPEVLDVDRYMLDGQETDSVVAVRELDPKQLPNQSWNNIRTVYTHGYGVVAAYGNRSVSGEPEWISKDLPPVGELGEFEPRIYFGETHTDYSVVGRPEGAGPVELDTPGGGEGGGPTLNEYDGDGGVPIGNWFVRLMYAVRFADYNMVLSERVNENSQVIYQRTPQERVRAAAPWLQVDSNVYPTVVDGRVLWVVDAYTTSNNFPNSQRLSLQQATADADTQPDPELARTDQVNYIRNSVKAVVDAYDGSVTLYEWDASDPVLQTWKRALPGSVTPKDEISDELMQHLRYPEDLFKVQRQILASYHVTDPLEWIANNDLWAVPGDPVSRGKAKQPPYYLQVRWPNEENAVFSQTATYVPKGRQNLVAFMAVNADATSEEYGRIRILRMNDQTQIDGPGQTFNAMVTSEAVAARLRPFLNNGAATVTYGNLMTLPVGGGLLYAQPVYTQRAGAAGGAYPALTFVIVRFGQKVGIGETLDAALDEVFGGDSGADTGEKGSDSTKDPGTTKPGKGKLPDGAASALAEASRAFDEADEALRKGDLATYQKKIEEARKAIERAQGG